jgi:hypothetical protein
MTTFKYTFPKVCYSASNPTINEDASKGYIKGTLLINTITDERFVCKGNDIGAAMWIRDIDCIDPAAQDVPDHQDMIDSKHAQHAVLVTPQIYYQDGSIAYNAEIPGNAFSAGPIAIESGYTITVGTSGSWTII